MTEQYNTNHTFQELVNETKNYIKANCMNIANYAAIATQLKSGYKLTERIGGQYTAGSVNYYYTNIDIVENMVSQVSAGTVDTDMTNYLTSIGRTNLSAIIPETEVLQFIEELMVFAYNHCWFITSQYTPNSILIYGSNTSVAPLPKTYFNLIRASDMLQLINNFTTNIKVVARHLTAKYRYTWNWSAKSESGASTSNVWYII